MARLKKVQSKRQTLHQKYKIQKKVKEAHRKSKKDAALGGKKLKKDPGIPNLWPFKEEFIHKLQLAKEKGEEEKARQKEDRKKVVDKRRKETKTTINGIQSLASSASARTEEFEANSMKKGKEEEYMKTIPNHLQFKDGSKKAYFREFKKIIEHADVVLEVLDARDPLGCRCLDIEKKILTKDPNKKIILILNKVDLIPKENIEQWLKYLRNEYPTIAFKCSTQSQKKNLGQGTGSIKDTSAHALESSESLGAENLLQLLKNYARNLNLKTSVTVGIIGYPNVGKSSLINSLKRTRAVGVGSTPGFTKTVQQVQLDKNIKLLDCPGIVFGNTTNSDNDVILRNAVKVEQIPDPIEPVEAILKRVKTEQMMTLFQISEFKTTTEFLIQIAMRRGKLAQGGVANLKEAARTVLQDWNAGKIPFYTVPPKVKNVHLSSTVVSNWGKEFDIDSIIKQEKESLSTLSSAKNQGKFMAMTPGDTEQDVMLDDDDENDDEDVEGEDMNDEDDDQIEDDDEEEEDMEEMEDDIAPQIEIKKSGKKTNVNTPTVAPTSKSNKAQKLFDKNEEAANPQKNKNMKANLKKQKKNAKKSAKNKDFESEEEEDEEEEVPVKSKATSKSTKSNKKGSKNESYDFGEYFGNDDGDMEDDDIRLSDI